MLSPTKYMDLGSSVLRLSAVALEELFQAEALRLDELEHRFLEAAGENGRRNLAATLSFLFLIGKIEFVEDLDAIVLAGSEPR